MKRNISQLALLFLSFGLITLVSCNKDARQSDDLEGQWTFTSFTVNNANALLNPDLTSSDYIIEMQFYADANFDVRVTAFDIAGNPSFSNYYGDWTIEEAELKCNNDESPGYLYPFLDRFSEPIEEFSYEAYDIIELDDERLRLEGSFEEYEVEITAIRE